MKSVRCLIEGMSEDKQGQWGVYHHTTFKPLDGSEDLVLITNPKQVTREDIGLNAVVSVEQNGKYWKMKNVVVERSGNATPVTNVATQPGTFKPSNTLPPSPKQGNVTRESLRKDAEQAIHKNIMSAQNVCNELGWKDIPESVLIELGDAIGRCITAMHIESNKRY